MQESVFLKVKKLDPRAKIPSKRSEDAGYDLYALYDKEYVILRPQEIWLAPTGLSTEFPKNWVFLLFERSSVGSKGIARRCGVIDSGYRGEIKVALQNTSSRNVIFISNSTSQEKVLEKENLKEADVLFYPQEKAIAQAILLYAPHVDIEEVDELSGDSQRQEGGFGSTNL
ncbi:MAG: dUTP diphosphatase [Candidatus Nanoarchaeia archaeon]